MRLKDLLQWARMGLFTVILLSWGIAFFEHGLQVPANRAAMTGMAALFLVAAIWPVFKKRTSGGYSCTGLPPGPNPCTHTT